MRPARGITPPQLGARSLGVGIPNRLLLKLSGNGRHFVDQAGAPILGLGDAAWSLAAQLSGSALDQYIDTIYARGVRFVLWNLFEHQFSDNAPNNALGVAPFSTANDIRTLNASYFNHIHTVQQKIRAKSMWSVLAPWYFGFNGGSEGWYDAAIATRTNGELTTFAQNIASELGRYDNIVWVNGGDYTPADLTKTNVLGDALKAADPLPHLMTFHTGPSSSSTAAGVGSWCDFNAVYVWDTTGCPSRTVSAPGMLHAYNASPTKAWCNFEARYEGGASSVQWIREQLYGEKLAGGCLSIPGNETTGDRRWAFDAGWENTLTSELTLDYDHFAAFFSGRAWWLLVPDTGSAFATAGRGTAAADGYRTAALASDNSWGAAYVPNGSTGGNLTLALPGGSSYVCQRFNPRTGAYSSLGTLSGSQAFSFPDGNDYVLVVERA